MIIFFTPSVSHLEQRIGGKHGHYKLRRFNDGELLLKLEENIAQEPVTVVTGTYPPAKNFCELLFLLDTLKQQSAHIHVIFTYFGYERQDHPKPYVARGAQIITNCLKQFDLENITIIHPHSPALKTLVGCQELIPFDVYVSVIKPLNIDVIVAPDSGAITNCQILARLLGCSVCTIDKERIGLDKVSMEQLDASVSGKRTLIFDDIMSTGSTIEQAALQLKAQGASAIYALATHSFLNNLGLQKLTAAPIDHIWLGNTIPVYLTSPQVSVIDVAPSVFDYITNPLSHSTTNQPL